MTDQITETLHTSMAQIVEMTPEAPALPATERSARTKRPVVALVSGFAAVVVTVGVVTAALTLPESTNVGSGGTGDSGLTTEEAAFVELDAAAFATAECIEDLGLKVQTPTYDAALAVHAFGWVTGTDAQEAAALACVETVYVPVHTAWAPDNDPSYALAVLETLVNTAEKIAPEGMRMSASWIDKLPPGDVSVGTVEFNTDPLGDGHIGVVIAVNSPWDPEADAETVGGSIKLTLIPGIGEALVDDELPGISIAWPHPKAVTVTVVGRDTTMDVLASFAARLQAALLQATG